MVFLKSPAPAYSSAYTYMAPRVMEYGAGPYSHSSYKAGGYYSKTHSDMAAHASEIVPVVAASSVRYGDRISPNQVSSSAQQAAVPSPRPIHRHRINRNRGNLGRPKAEYSQPPVSNTPPPAAAPLPAEDYTYQAPQYEPEVSKPQVETMKIAIIPMKASELADLAGQTNSAELSKQSTSQADKSLPENLLNYIRQVQEARIQGSTDSIANTASEQAKPVESSASALPLNEAIESNTGEKWRTVENTTSISTGTEAVHPVLAGQPIAVLTQLRPQTSSFNIEHQHNHLTPSSPSSSLSAISSPIQSQWQQNMPPVAAPIVHSHGQHQPSEYVYRPPELKVIRNLPRWNPKEEQEQVRSKPTPVIVPLQQSSLKPQVSHSQVVSEPANRPSAGPPQQSQFIYSVSHQNYPQLGAPYLSSADRYPNLDNFGLTSFRISQQPNKPNYTSSPSLATSASLQSAKWIKPEKQSVPKSKFLNNFGNRLSSLF